MQMLNFMGNPEEGKGKQKTRPSLTPFLDQLIKSESIYMEEELEVFHMNKIST